ncbi:MAG: hypothetical protein Q8Q89_04340 [bacterium]|nr:hypothetical protein [bacterium]
MKEWKVGIIGVGMVGTPLKRWFEENGYKRGEDLFLYDIDPQKKYFDDINQANIIFIAVPTPRDFDGRCDLSAVKNALFRIDMSLSKIIVIKSTIPPGTTEYFQFIFKGWKMLFNPEFLTERRAWEDFIRPDRQIVGFTDKSLDAAHAVLSLLPKAPFMSPWGLSTYKQVRITATEAEIIKYGGNIHFVRKVNFANMVNVLCRTLGVDYENVRNGIAADFRIGDSHLDVNHGGYRGWGGYCFPKDLDAFITILKNTGNEEGALLLEADRDFNVKLLTSQCLTIEDVSKHNFRPNADPSLADNPL